MCVHRQWLILIIHAILWCSECCDCNKDKYDKRNAFCYDTLRITAVRIRHQVSSIAVQMPQLLWMSLTDLCSGLSCSKRWLSCKWNLVEFWMHLSPFRCFRQHLKILLQSLRALCLAPGGPGSIYKYLVVRVMSNRVSGRILFLFETNLHFADIELLATTGSSHTTMPPQHYRYTIGAGWIRRSKCEGYVESHNSETLTLYISYRQDRQRRLSE